MAFLLVFGLFYLLFLLAFLLFFGVFGWWWVAFVGVVGFTNTAKKFNYNFFCWVGLCLCRSVLSWLGLFCFAFVGLGCVVFCFVVFDIV